MLWFYLSLTTALTLATIDALSKYALRDSGEEVVAWISWGLAIPFLLVIVPFIETPPLDSTFWLSTIAALPLEVIAVLLYVKAIKISPLSLTIPFLALTPVFLIATSFVMLGELPNPSGIMGIFLIAIGAYFLNLNSLEKGFLAPMKAIVREKGSIMMIGVAFIYSITSNLGKIAVIHSSALFFTVAYTIIFSIFFLPYVIFKERKIVAVIKGRIPLFLLIGFLFAIMVSTHFMAISLTKVSYMISVKRTSLIFSVLFGWLFFKEEHVRERLLGSIVMVTGVLLITLF